MNEAHSQSQAMHAAASQSGAGSPRLDPVCGMSVDPATAKAHADAKLVNNVMFYLGVGFYLPTGFQYKTPR